MAAPGKADRSCRFTGCKMRTCSSCFCTCHYSMVWKVRTTLLQLLISGLPRPSQKQGRRVMKSGQDLVSSCRMSAKSCRRSADKCILGGESWKATFKGVEASKIFQGAPRIDRRRVPPLPPGSASAQEHDISLAPETTDERQQCVPFPQSKHRKIPQQKSRWMLSLCDDGAAGSVNGQTSTTNSEEEL